jgi:hypothetical protein
VGVRYYLLPHNFTVTTYRRSTDSTRDSAARRAYVLGRISLFLETLPQISDNSELRTEIAELQHEIEQLEANLSDENIQERLDSILSFISRDLTRWVERQCIDSC